MTIFVRDSDKPTFQRAILTSLVADVFDEIGDREALIVEPYESTFGWVFQKPSSTGNESSPSSIFPDWLEGNDKSAFWITGKPGSGKSTLMKFILSRPELKNHLKEHLNGRGGSRCKSRASKLSERDVWHSLSTDSMGFNHLPLIPSPSYVRSWFAMVSRYALPADSGRSSTISLTNI